MEHIHVTYSVLYGQSWLPHSYDIMFSHLMHVSKQDVLNCLHIIPSHLRPLYITLAPLFCSLTSHPGTNFIFHIFITIRIPQCLSVCFSLWWALSICMFCFDRSSSSCWVWWSFNFIFLHSIGICQWSSLCSTMHKPSSCGYGCKEKNRTDLLKLAFCCPSQYLLLRAIAKHGM